MSLDKLKSSWDSLNDSVDQKEIVAIKEMRKELYESKYNLLKRRQIQSIIIGSSIMILGSVLRMIIGQKIDILSFFLLFAAFFFIARIVFTPNIGLKNIKMDDNIQVLKTHLQKRVKRTKIEFVIAVVIFPIILAVALELTKTNNHKVILIAFTLGTSCFNAISFYMFYSINKIYNSMLEDIKQLEELDIY